MHSVDNASTSRTSAKNHRFSTVYQCRHLATNEMLAVKVIEKSSLDDQESDAMHNEIAILKLVNHPNITRLREMFETRTHLYIVMRLVRGGDLFNRIKARKCFKEAVTREVIWSLFSAVKYLHARGIVHRDIKPENILCLDADDDSKIIISDFGLSKFATPKELMKVACGTLCYVAPEVLKCSGYGFSVDIWSIGVIMYLLLRGRLPFDGKTKDEIIDRTLTAPLDFSHAHWSTVSDEAKELLRMLLTKDPALRCSEATARAHPWFEPVRNRIAQQKAVNSVVRSVPSTPVVTAAVAATLPESFALVTSPAPAFSPAPAPAHPSTVSSTVEVTPTPAAMSTKSNSPPPSVPAPAPTPTSMSTPTAALAARSNSPPVSPVLVLESTDGGSLKFHLRVASVDGKMKDIRFPFNPAVDTVAQVVQEMFVSLNLPSACRDELISLMTTHVASSAFTPSAIPAAWAPIQHIP
jgi:serine/threonine protein kinase